MAEKEWEETYPSSFGCLCKYAKAEVKMTVN